MATPENLKAWRKNLRAQLLDRRLSVPAAQRHDWNNAIAEFLAQGFSTLSLNTAACYWPYQGEFDPRSTMRLLHRCGVKVALPVVVRKGQALEFRKWHPGAKMSIGVLDLPYPADTQTVVPEVLLIPLLGFDRCGYRLGYGGGFFDRTLAAMRPQPLKLGVGFELSAIDTIHPQTHDIAMDFVITETGVRWASASGLVRVNTASIVPDIAQAVVEQRRTDCRDDDARPVIPDGAQFSSPPCFAHEFDWYESAESHEPDK